MDLSDDLQAKKCPKCNSLMIRQEIDETWYCENCEHPYPDQEIEDQDNYRKCSKCGKDSGIFEFCVNCRPKE